MSKLSDFDSSAYKSSSSIIGTVTMKIGNIQFQIVDGEGNHQRDSEMGGFMSESGKVVVCSRIDYDTASPTNPTALKGRLCEVDGEEWRIQTITTDVNYITFNLIDTQDVA